LDETYLNPFLHVDAHVPENHAVFSQGGAQITGVVVLRALSNDQANFRNEKTEHKKSQDAHSWQELVLCTKIHQASHRQLSVSALVPPLHMGIKALWTIAELGKAASLVSFATTLGLH
jgi:hypothetical protein